MQQTERVLLPELTRSPLKKEQPKKLAKQQERERSRAARHRVPPNVKGNPVRLEYGQTGHGSESIFNLLRSKPQSLDQIPQYRSEKLPVNLSPIQNKDMIIVDFSIPERVNDIYHQNLDSQVGIRNTYMYRYENNADRRGHGTDLRESRSVNKSAG